MVSAKHVCFILDISPATLYRRINDGSIKRPTPMGPRLKKWPKEYILSLKRDGFTPPTTE